MYRLCADNMVLFLDIALGDAIRLWYVLESDYAPNALVIEFYNIDKKEWQSW